MLRSHAIMPFVAFAMCFATGASSEDIHLAARKGDTAWIGRLLDEGVPVDLPSTRNTSLLGVSALHIAAQFGHTDAVILLLAAGADPEYRPPAGERDGTPIHMASRRGSMEIVKLFLDQGVDPNLYVPWLGTPLHQARLNGHEELESFLIAQGAETHWSAPSINQELRNADVENGRSIAKSCDALCHRIDSESKELSLWNILGAPKAQRPGYDYSPVLLGLGGNWSYADLNSFLAAPSRYAPGTRMIISVQDVQFRADVIAFLRTLSDEPLPLP